MIIAFKLCRIWLLGIFSLKSEKHSIIKAIAKIVLLLYCAVAVGFIMFSVLSALYSFFKIINLQVSFLLIIASASFITTFFFGFLTVLSSYATNGTDVFLLATPISSRQLLTAKIMQTYVIEFLIAFAVICIGIFIYAKGESLLTSPLLYVAIIITGFSLPLFAVSLTYLILIVLFRCGKQIINKKIITIFSTIVVIFLSVSINIAYQKLIRDMQSETSFIVFSNTQSIENIISASSFFPPAMWFMSAINNLQTNPLLSIFYLLLLLGSSICIVALIIVLLSKAYISSIVGFDDVSVKKHRQTNDTVENTNKLAKKFRQKKVFNVLLKRDVLTIFREPSFFVNGPLMLFLLPIIFIISIMVSLPENAVQDISNLVDRSLQSYDVLYDSNKIDMMLYIVSGCCAVCASFLFSMDQISSTSFSREGKGFFILKSLPISMQTLINAKIVHSLIYVLYSIFIGAIPFVAFFIIVPVKFSAWQIIISALGFLLLSSSLSFLLIIKDLLFDTINPKLDWDNPVMAFKQNFNAFLGIISSLGLETILVLLGIFVFPSKMTVIFFVSFCFILMSFFFLRIYCNFAKTRLLKTE